MFQQDLHNVNLHTALKPGSDKLFLFKDFLNTCLGYDNIIVNETLSQLMKLKRNAVNNCKYHQFIYLTLCITSVLQ